MSLPPPTLPHCYRHPDREAGRHCTRCGKPACSDCLVQAAVGSHCVDCAKAARPDVATRAKLASSRVLAPTTLALIAVNLGVFIIGAARDGGGLGGNVITATQANLGVSKAILQGRVGGLDGLPIPAHEWYRLATAGFVHFGIFHIAMNMLLLYQLGNLLERVIGSGRLLLLYVAGLFAGSLGVLVADVIGPNAGGITGGASGAVFGLMAAAAIGMHRRGINVFRTGIGTTLMLNLVLTFAINGVSVGGHLGGLAGALLAASLAACAPRLVAPPSPPAVAPLPAPAHCPRRFPMRRRHPTFPTGWATTPAGAFSLHRACCLERRA